MSSAPRMDISRAVFATAILVALMAPVSSSVSLETGRGVGSLGSLQPRPSHRSINASHAWQHLTAEILSKDTAASAQQEWTSATGAHASALHLGPDGVPRALSGSGPLYVASTGSDVNTGDSPAAPKRTIAAAIAAAAGRHIHIAGGTYAVTTLNLVSNTLLWGGWSSDFSSRSPESFPTFINADNVGFQCTSRSNILLEGLRVTVSRSSGHTVYGVKLRSCSNVRVHNTRIVVAEGGDGSNGSPGTDGANGGE